jgi:hypothetical protein
MLMKKNLVYLLAVVAMYALNSCKPTCNGTISLGLAVLMKDKITGDSIKANTQTIVLKSANALVGTTVMQIGAMKSPFDKYAWIQFNELRVTGNYTFEVLVNGVSKGSFDMTLGRTDNCEDAVSNIENMNSKGNTELEFNKKFVGISNAEWLLTLKN